VIQNDDGLAALRERTHAVHDEILKRFVARA
jgi:hypothetical protein